MHQFTGAPDFSIASAKLLHFLLKIKVGQPDPMEDLRRLDAVTAHLGGRVPLMVDANQQWDRVTALRFGRLVEPLNQERIEEPLDAHDHSGHAALADDG